MPKKATSATSSDPLLADAARISPQQIWQAGLGAFIKAQAEGDRAFARLVSEGSELQERTRGEQSDPDEPRAPASWHKLEQIFEDRVARALTAMAVPTHHDIAQLQRQVEELRQAVDALSGLTKKAAPKKNAAPAAKAAPKKKAAAGKQAR